MEEEVFFEPRLLKPSSTSLFVDSPFGPIEVWADENGIYIDLFDKDEGNICLASVHPENFGLSAMIYENYGHPTPTQRGFFYDVPNAFKHLVITEGGESVDDFLKKVYRRV